jgi:DNA-directed RNA polymerase specialized sigma24 family protein
MNRFSNPSAGHFNGTARAYGARNGDRRDDRPVGEAEDAGERTAIAAAKRGEWDGIHYLYARHADDVFSHVLSIVRDRAEAEDITQNTFLKLVSEITGYEERSMPFAAWIRCVAGDATPRPASQDRR